MDDLAVDLLWLSKIAFRKPELLPPPSEQRGHFAMIIPAWDESAVIGAMLSRLISTIDNDRLRIFVGVYSNDPETLAAVNNVVDPRIQTIIADHSGPTTKADCLNALWRGVVEYELAAGIRFKAVVLHDAEDVVHPLSLEIYDRYLPALAMVQLPVLPLQDNRTPWVSGHYCDEFAQAHAKDMMIRSLLDTPVPSAGVGTAIDRELLEVLAGPSNAPFDASSLTEDYELGHKVHAMGRRGRMVRVRVNGELVATRAFFPSTIEAAVQQKSRWLTGIALAGWDRLGWGGTWAARWMQLRDRKGLMTAAMAMIGYGAAVLLLVQIVARWLAADSAVNPFPPLLGGPTSWLPAFLLFNAALLGWRLAMRGYLTSREYGAAEGLMAMPRAIMANAINFLAAMKAVERYRMILDQGHVVWGKTAHRFPTPSELPQNG